MKHFRLNLVDGNPSKAVGINRKFQSIKINSLSEPVDDLLKFHHLHSLEITKCTLAKEDLAFALEDMKLLENFSANSVRFDGGSEKTSVKAVQLNHLKKLTLKYTSVFILNTFLTKTLQSFTFHNIESQQDPTLIVELLKHQQSLERLEIAGTICDHLLANSSVKIFPFKLKFFKIDKADLNNTESSNHLIEFLKLHENSLDELSIKQATTSEVKRFIFNNMTGLKALQMSFGRQCAAGLNDLQPLLNVTRLKILGDAGNAPNTMKILKLFPSLDALNMIKFTIVNHYNFYRIFQFIHQQYPELKRLHCAYLQFGGNDIMLFMNLKELHVAKFFDENEFNEFVRNHATSLEKISIKTIKDDLFVRGLTIDAIKKCKSLKHISFSSESPVVTKMFNKVKMNHSWSLESRFLINEFGDDGKWVKLLFKFPDDEAVWLENCRTYDDELVREFYTTPNYGLNAFVNKFK